jgi:hypothetical protein
MKMLMLFLLPASMLITGGISYAENWTQWGSSWARFAPGPGPVSTDTKSVEGLGFFKDEEIKQELVGYGPGTFYKVKAHKDVTIYGAASTSDATFKNLTVYGTVNADTTTFAKVILYTTESSFDKCTLSSLRVESKQKPVIKLVNTTINGNVKFNGKKGKLKLSGNSTIKGTVENGEIIKVQ